MVDLPPCFYRVSVKALILNEHKDKFLICEETDGRWELPGGGLEWGATPQGDLVREIQEEMGLLVTMVAKHPAYFFSAQTENSQTWIVNVLYEATVSHLNFTPSDECVNIRFVDKADIQTMRVFPTITMLGEVFDPQRHRLD
jgi:8-oxo-dGTP diphosphatase